MTRFKNHRSEENRFKNGKKGMKNSSEWMVWQKTKSNLSMIMIAWFLIQIIDSMNMRYNHLIIFWIRMW